MPDRQYVSAKKTGKQKYHYGSSCCGRDLSSLSCYQVPGVILETRISHSACLATYTTWCGVHVSQVLCVSERPLCKSKHHCSGHQAVKVSMAWSGNVSSPWGLLVHVKFAVYPNTTICARRSNKTLHFTSKLQHDRFSYFATIFCATLRER